MRGRFKAVGVVALCILLGSAARPVLAQNTLTGSKKTTLWVDENTGQVFVRPGHGRLPMVLGGSVDADQIHDQVQSAVAASETEQKQENEALRQKVDAMSPAWQDYADHWLKKFKIGTTIYADYGLYTHTGYGPQFTENVFPPGPGNNMYNSFDLTRAYLNFLFMPDENFTFRVTPDIYRSAGTVPVASNGKSSSIGSNLDGNLNLRIKYGYVNWNTPFVWNQWLKKDSIRFGIEQEPLVDWEEHLWGYRYVGLVPWNYLSLSSSYAGLAIKGPISFGSQELEYVDYDIGVFDNANFHHYQQANTKDIMARLTVYPFGAKKDFDGLGITGFYDYGYNNKNADVTTGSGSNRSLARWAALLHYNAEHWGIAGEFDWGKNAFTSGNLFSASGPVAGSSEATLATLVQSASTSHQLGYDFLGHVDVPRTPFTLFGLFEQTWSNTQVSKNPFDFQRFIVGVEYKYSKHLRFAFDSQNILFYHKQFAFTAADIAAVDATSTLTPVTNPVPRDTHAFFLNMEFDY